MIPYKKVNFLITDIINIKNFNTYLKAVVVS